MTSDSHPILKDILSGVKEDPLIEVGSDLMAISLYPFSPTVKSDADLERWAGENDLSFERVTLTHHGKPRTLFRFSLRKDP
ncbi:MAG TPA: hypothetical protein VFD58_36260 [Blastocatellia bacterium]|nr:hypothetical protein [Blastocatellia bacterium]